MLPLFLFIFGLVIGSFLNVVSMRYDGHHFVLDPNIIGGRSHCISCGKTLRWFELVPLFSFLIQSGRCRRCKAKISIQYPVVELISGLIFVLVPWRAAGLASAGSVAWLLPALWTLAFLTLFLASIIDIRIGIIPDELNLALGVLAIAIGFFFAMSPGANGSLAGPFDAALGVSGSVWAGKIIGTVFGFLFFEFLVLVTRRKGIGMGDVKLALPLGFLFGWPDMVLVTGFAFVCGAAVGTALIALKKKTMRGSLPFGPFLAFSAAAIFFLGIPAAQWYFHLMGL